MAFRGVYMLFEKRLCIENKVLEQVPHFSYLGCDISLENDEYIKNTKLKFQSLCGIVKKRF
jgi:hypothetical protein